LSYFARSILALQTGVRQSWVRELGSEGGWEVVMEGEALSEMEDGR
jgi:hypothetical protein